MTTNIFGVYGEALKLRGQRASVLATNLANAETPGYKARDFDFNQVLAKRVGNEAGLTTTSRSHITATSQPLGALVMRYRMMSQPSLDGNTVDIQKERAEFMQNSMRYQASLRFLNGRIRGLMTAIRGE